ncbi:MAG: alpha/beta fold hydrolase, partial [Rhodocyclaceae bacterium]|nr:alpha/beta fold hydrolase [Rhodocyclaceae bacterium]
MKANVNGIAVEYQVEGTGPWVMLSHSLSTDRSMWDEQASVLASRHSVLRYDTRGHGGTDVPPAPYRFDDLAADALGLLDALGIDRVRFVGLSMGGMIGQHLALMAPERLDRMAICSSTSRVPAEGRQIWAERIATVRAEGMGAMVDSTLGRWFTEGFRQGHPDVMERIGGLIRNSPPEGYIGCGMAIRDLDITARLA